MWAALGVVILLLAVGDWDGAVGTERHQAVQAQAGGTAAAAAATVDKADYDARMFAVAGAYCLSLGGGGAAVSSRGGVLRQLLLDPNGHSWAVPPGRGADPSAGGRGGVGQGGSVDAGHAGARLHRRLRPGVAGQGRQVPPA